MNAVGYTSNKHPLHELMEYYRTGGPCVHGSPPVTSNRDPIGSFGHSPKRLRIAESWKPTIASIELKFVEPLEYSFAVNQSITEMFSVIVVSCQESGPLWAGLITSELCCVYHYAKSPVHT